MKLIHIAAMATLRSVEPRIGIWNRQQTDRGFYRQYKLYGLQLSGLSRQQITQAHQSPQGLRSIPPEHYGRHGSRLARRAKRLHIAPREILLKADADGKLTPRGKEVLNEVLRHSRRGTSALGRPDTIGRSPAPRHCPANGEELPYYLQGRHKG